MLWELGRRPLDVETAPALFGVFRSIMSEALRFPELAKAFYEKGAGRASDSLAEVLEAARDSGEIELYDCHAAADHFVGMFRDNFHLRVLLGISSPREPAEAAEIGRAHVRTPVTNAHIVDRL